MEEAFLANIVGEPTPSMLEQINKLSKRPLSKEEVFVFPGKLIGNGLITSRFQRVAPELLRVFGENANAGVSLLIDHSWANLGTYTVPYGRTFGAAVRKSVGGEAVGESEALYAYHYIIRGMTAFGLSTDDLIKGIESGVMFDTSIGFRGRPMCSICNTAIWECAHIPGKTYDGKTCEIHWHSPGKLMENSIVFDGAYPGAGILSAAGENREKASPFIPVDDLKSLSPDSDIFCTYSASHGIQVFTKSKPAIEVVSINTQKEGVKRVELTEKFEAAVKELLKVEAVDEAALDRVAGLAKDGIAYHEALDAQVLEMGVRAEGNDFAKEFYEGLLKSPTFTVAQKQELLKQFKARAEKELKAGRLSVPTDADSSPKPTVNEKVYSTKKEADK
jgi:hypothetical protein